MTPHATLEVGDDQVAIITLKNPPVNALHPSLINSIMDKVREAHSRSDVKALVLMGDSGKFSAGFDINMFVDTAATMPVVTTTNDVFREILEAGPKPTVAAIQGLALGGGLELAMACNSRLAAPGSNLGLPELSLGLLPGFGGTQRLPRLVGLEQALQMMLTSKPIKDKQALKSGLIDGIFPPDQLLPAARKLALEIADKQKPRNSSLARTDKLASFGEAMAILDFAGAETSRKAPHLTHPHLCLEAIRHGIQHGGVEGIKKEVENFAKAGRLDTHKALVHIFFASRSTKKVSGVTDAGLRPRTMKKIAVLGGGLMGSGIATAALQAGIDVVLKEINEKFLEAGIGRIKSNFASQVKKGKMSQQAVDKLLQHLKGTLTYDDFRDIDMVIEAAIENVPLKQKIFQDLEKACSPNTILATNTSTIDISLVGKKTKSADRVIGAHFFSPAHIMPLLEIVRTDETSKQVVLDTLMFGAKIRKTPVVVGNCTGFAVNRVFFPYTQAACLLVDSGLDPYTIDKTIALGFGMPMGPFRLSDLVGADIGAHVGENFAQDFSERIYPTKLMHLLVEAKTLGEKTGSGFYKFDKKRKASPNPDVQPILQKSREEAGLMKGGAKPRRLSPQEIIEFIFFPVVNEGCRVIAEGIVDKPADLDVATVLAMGFPAYRGGIIKWADLVGVKHVHDTLEKYAKQYESAGLSGFFKPCKYLADAAANGTQLSAGIKTSKL